MSIELLRVEFRIVGLSRDENGEITGSDVLADGVAYPTGLDDLPASIRRVVAEANVPEGGKPCPDCAAAVGDAHEAGCASIGCGNVIWTGELYPRERALAIERGWYTQPGEPDLNRAARALAKS